MMFTNSKDVQWKIWERRSKVDISWLVRIATQYIHTSYYHPSLNHIVSHLVKYLGVTLFLAIYLYIRNHRTLRPCYVCIKRIFVTESFIWWNGSDGLQLQLRLLDLMETLRLKDCQPRLQLPPSSYFISTVDSFRWYGGPGYFSRHQFLSKLCFQPEPNPSVTMFAWNFNLW